MSITLSKILIDGNEDFDSLTELEQNVFILASIRNAVNSSGIVEFYRGEGGARQDEAIELLEALDLDEIAFVLDSIGAIFPEGYPPTDRGERNELIAELEEDYADLFDEWTEQILDFISPLNNELDTLLKELE